MPEDSLTWALVGITLAFVFLNGYNDSASIVATMVASGALAPRRALALAAGAELIGPFLFGVAVAATIGRGVLDPAAVTRELLIAAVVGALAWGLLAAWLGVPTSATHALVGGLVGASVAAAGPGAVAWGGVAAVVFALALAPTLGLIGGYLLMRQILRVGAYLTPRVNLYLKRVQIGTSVLVALSHGANDSQKGMGVIAVGLVASGALDEFAVPTWVIASCALAIALGTALGGQATLRTLGLRIYRIRPIHGFAVQSATAAIVVVASMLGGPVSTTQVATSAIFGAGAGERMGKVRWELGQQILVAWAITLPVAALASALAFLVGSRVLVGR